MVQRKKNKTPVLLVHAKGFFQASTGARWTSELAWARIVYKPAQDRIIIIEKFGQKPVGGSSTGDAEWVDPVFSKQAIERMTDFARRVYNGVSGSTSGGDKPKLKGHRQDLCKRCTTQGRPCWEA